jgi:hypothetical protein
MEEFIGSVVGENTESFATFGPDRGGGTEAESLERDVPGATTNGMHSGASAKCESKPNVSESGGFSGATVAELAEMMDAELLGTEVPKSFRADAEGEDDGENEVNIDLNLLSNVLKSHSAQHGLAGPVSSLLGSLGIGLPGNADEEGETKP